MATGTVGRRAQRGWRTRKRRPLRAAHHDRNRTPARHRLLVSRLRAGQRVRPDREWPDLDDDTWVASPGRGAGRHFVGRGLQRTARTVDDAVGYLRSRPPRAAFLHDRRPGGPGRERRSRRRPRAVTEAGVGRGPRCGTPTTAATSGAEPEADGTSAARGQTLDALGARPRPGSVLVPGGPDPPAAGRHPLRPWAGRPRADHAVHARRRPDRGGGRDHPRTARRLSRSRWPTWPKAAPACSVHARQRGFSRIIQF